MHIDIQNYHSSDSFDINTFGISGQLKLKKKSNVKKDPHSKYNPIDPALEEGFP